MGRKRQHGNVDQGDLFDCPRATLRRGDAGDGGAVPGAQAVSQAPAAVDRTRALTQHMMEDVVASANLNFAYKRVKANRGSPGVDGMTVDDLLPWIRMNRERLIGALIDGSYRPQPVRGVSIPKAGGGMRQLGIPTVVDRLVQQAIAQVLEPLLDPTFSVSSFGFRPGRNAHAALQQARQYVADGRNIVVDIDLEAFFDRVNHDVLMARLARRVGDPRLLKITRRFLEAGLMREGIVIARIEGTPQGGPLSPLLANLLLDDLDKELEKRGHRFCRYADDCNVYVRSLRAGERVMASVVAFLEGRLRLKVNRLKSAVARTEERSFLGHRLLPEGRLGIAPKGIARARQRLKAITRRNRGIAFSTMIAETNAFTTGWVTYFRHAEAERDLSPLDKWLRRRLRCVRLKQCKQSTTIEAFLVELGVSREQARTTAGARAGWWRKSKTPAAHRGMSLAWFEEQRLQNLSARHAALQLSGNRRDTRSVRPVV